MAVFNGSSGNENPVETTYDDSLGGHASSKSVVFFDAHVEQYLALGDCLPAGVDRVVLDHRRDGIEQIADYLSGRTGIEAIHVVCHGSPGALCLGDTVVSGESLAGHGPWLRAIGQSLVPGGDILLYGCNVAAGDLGRAFVAGLAAFTGANVAASADATGASALGGNAALEKAVGAVAMPPVFTQSTYDALGVHLGTLPSSLPQGPNIGLWFQTNVFGNMTSSESIASSSEVELWEFVPNTTGFYTFTIPSGPLDAQFRVYGSNGAPISAVIDDPFLPSATETVTLNLTEGVWTYLAVAGFGTSTGAYTLLVDGPDANAPDLSVAAPTFAQTYQASIGNAGDIDYWRITAPAGTSSLNLSLTPTGFNSWLDLNRSDGTFVQRFDNGGVGGVDSGTNIPVTPGTSYYVAVSAASREGSGGYSLTIDFNPDDFGDPPATITPNTGTVLRLNPFGDVTRSGNVTPAGEFTPPFSLYQFHVESPGNHVISVSGTLDTQLRVYDSSGAALTGIIDGPGAGGTESTTLNLGSTGWVYVAVGGFQNQTGPFTLTVNGPDYDTVAIPTPALAFIGSNGGSIGEAGDVDYWSITAPAGTNSLDLSVVPSTALDTLIELYDSTGALLQTIDSPSAGSQGAGVTDTATGIAVTAGGNFFVGVSSNSRTSTGNYTVSADFNPDQADTTAPTVQTFSPADEATGVSQGSNIVATFSEAIQRGTGTIVLRNAAGAAIETYQAATAAQISISGSQLTLDPSADLAAGAGFRVDFDLGSVKDLAGNPYAGTTTYNFTTASAPDTTPPTVTTVTPFDGATGVATGSDIVLVFSESIQRGTGNILLKTASGTTVETFAAASSSNLGISGSTLTINPTVDLNFGTQYRVELAAGTLKDGAGNSYTGNASGYSFTTLPASNSNVLGTPGPDTLTGGAGSEQISGLGSDDRMTGGGGNDTIDGGSGTDTAIYAGARAGFTVAKQGNTFTITDKTGAEGTDTLTTMEKLQFSDKLFDLVNPPRTSVPDYGKDGGFLFDPVFYLLNNPELVPTVGLDTALQNYRTVGAAQDKAPNSWFSADYYANKWADLKPLQLDDATLFAHYNLYGVWEGRSGGPKFELFDGNRYLAENPDVAAYVDANVDDFLGSRSNGAIAHFIIYGNNEQRLAYDLVGQAIDMGYIV